MTVSTGLLSFQDCLAGGLLRVGRPPRGAARDHDQPGAEHHVRGGHAAARPGKAHARAVLAEPVGERIWFAGEALAGGLKQTVSGARLSGEAVAEMVALRLALQDHQA